jgi:hypothetical protein
MRILIVTDAWEPQVNGVVRTLKTTARELTKMNHEVRFLTPLDFRTLPCPTYPEIRLSLFPQSGVERQIREFDPDVLHIATEGPLGMAARRPSGIEVGGRHGTRARTHPGAIPGRELPRVVRPRGAREGVRSGKCLRVP